MTIAGVIYQGRVATIAHAAEMGNVSEAGRIFGVARQTLSDWISTAKRYGMSALMPKGRRRPQQPNEMAAWEIATIPAEAIARPIPYVARSVKMTSEGPVDSGANVRPPKPHHHYKRGSCVTSVGG